VFNFFKQLFSKKDIRYASVGSVGIKFGSAFFAFLNGVLLARYLTVEGFGYYVLSFSTIMILSIPITAGIPSLITRYVSKYEVNSNIAAIKGLLIRTNGYALIAIAGIYALAVLTYFFWWNQYAPVLVETLFYAFLLLPLLGLGALRSAALRGLKLVILAELPDTLLRNGLLTVFIGVCIASDITLTPQLAIIFQVVSAAIGFVVGLYFLQKKLLRHLKSVTAKYHNKEWFKQTIPFSINSGIQVLKLKLLSYVLVIFGSIEAVAIFDVAMRGAALVSFTLDALNMAIAPFISSAFEHGNKKDLQNIVKKTARIIFATSLPVALLFIIGGEQLIELIFGIEYTLAYIPLAILCVGQLVNAMTGSVGLVLNMTGYQSVFSKFNIILLIINLLCSIPAIIYFDVVGASLVFSGILIIQNILLIYQVRKRLQINTTIF
jgi:O-antigen/teichoic acid export membrane protein